jgi:hypothetical protein
MSYNEVECFDIAEIKVETRAAILVVSNEGWERWIPKSVIDDESEVFDKQHETGTLIIARRFAEEKGMS